MLRVKVPAGQLSPQRAARDRRGLEPLRPGRRRALDAAEHPAALARAREAARRLRAPRGGGRRRPPAAAATPCATSPAARSRASPPTSSSTRRRSSTPPPTYFYGNPDWAEPAAQAQVLDLGLRRPLQRAGDQLHLADRHRARRRPRGLRASSSAAASRRCRGSPATWASSSRRRRRTRSSARSPSVWSEDLKYRVSRVKARLKFMVDDIGPEGIRERVEARLGREARGLHAAADRRRAVAPPRRPRAEAGRASSYIGVPVHLGPRSRATR